jgi:hypothetical protein
MIERVNRATVALPVTATLVALAASRWDPPASDGAYVGWWVGAMALLAPLLHVGGGWPHGHGARAIGWLGVLPFVWLFASEACARPLTGSWFFICGNSVLGLIFLPVIVGAFVAGACALSFAFIPSVRRWIAAPTLVAVGTITLLFSLGVVGTTLERNAAGPDELLRDRVATLAPIPAREGDFDVVGTHVTRTCHHEGRCTITVDGIETSATQEDALELAEGFGYRFVRAPGSAPSTWHVFRPGDTHGTVLTARDLGSNVGAPSHLGAALALAALVAAIYIGLAWVALGRVGVIARAVAAEIVSPGVARIGDSVASCDASLPIGPAVALTPSTTEATYRDAPRAHATILAGTRDALIDAQRGLASEHVTLALTLLLLGLTPIFVAISQRLVLRW